MQNLSPGTGRLWVDPHYVGLSAVTRARKGSHTVAGVSTCFASRTIKLWSSSGVFSYGLAPRTSLMRVHPPRHP